MALLSILTGLNPRRTKFQDAKGLDLMVVDATVSFEPTYESEVTEHPVEEGPDITDHIRPKPLRLRLEGVASETPITLGASLAGLATTGAMGTNQAASLGAAGNAVAGAAAGIGVNLLKSAQNPAEVMRDFLIGLLKERKTFTLWTPEGRYDNLVLVDVTFPKDTTTGRALRFAATMKQLTLVKSELIRLENVDRTVLHTATKEGKLGKQAAQPLNEQKQRGSSLLYSGLQSLGAIK